jgi:phospholipid/cholesterol/gamma-HCH transport system substrate-binding protein
VKDDVVIMGTLQGKVIDIEFFEMPQRCSERNYDLWVKVTVLMDIPFTLKRDYQIAIRNANLLGGKVLDIRLGQSPESVNPNTTMLVGLAVRDPVEAISEFIETNKIAVKSTLDKINNLVSNVSDWSDYVSQGKGTLGRIIKSEEMAERLDRIVAEADTFTQSLNRDDNTLALIVRDAEARAKVEKFMDNAVKVSDTIASGEGTLGKLVNSTELYDSAFAAVHNIEGAVDDFRAGEHGIGRLFSDDVDPTIDQIKEIVRGVKEGPGVVHALIFDDKLTNQVNSAVANFNDFTTGISSLIKDVQDGKGTVGMLLSDEKLAKKVEQIFDMLSASIEDAREAAPLLSLGSYLFGAI